MERSFWGWVIFLAVEYKDYFISGTITTLVLSSAGTIGGFLVGFLMGLIDSIELSSVKGKFQKGICLILMGISKVYVTVFRGTPMIVQAMVIFYGSSQVFGINLPTYGAAILVVTLNTGAYMAETVRGGILSIEQ